MYKDDLLDPIEQQKIALINSLLKLGNPPYYRCDKPAILQQLSVNTTKLTQIVTDICNDLAPEIKEGLFELSLNRSQVSLHFTPAFTYADLLYKYLIKAPNVRILLYLLMHPFINKYILNQELGLNHSAYFRRIKRLNGLLGEFDIQIKNGRLVGNELNIRYFYTRLGVIFNQHELADEHNPSFWQAVTDLEAHLTITFNPADRFVIYWLSLVTQYRRRFMQAPNLVGLEKLVDFVTPIRAFDNFLKHYRFNYSTVVDVKEAVIDFTMLWVSDIFTSKNDNFDHFYNDPYLQSSALFQSYNFFTNEIDRLFPKIDPNVQRDISHQIWLIITKLSFTKGFLYTMTAFEIGHYHFTLGPNAPTWPQEQVDHFIRALDRHHGLTLAVTDYQFLRINLLSIIANAQTALTGHLTIGVWTNMHLPLARRFYSHILQELTYFNNVSIVPFVANQQYDYIITNVHAPIPTKITNQYILGLGTAADYAHIQVALLQIYQAKYGERKMPNE